VHAVVDTGPSRDPDVAVDGSHPTGEIRSLYVDPSVCDRGLGTVLLRAAIAALAAAGFTRGTLWVVEGNAPARAFYERRGWVPDETDGAVRDVPVDDEILHEVRYRLPTPLSPA
jgi:GNAT superfamily N-acetyltransferase